MTEFLGNDLGGGLRVEKAVADGLADQFLTATVVGAGASLLAEQAPGSLLQEAVAQLKVTLAAEAKLGGRLIRTQRTTFAFEEHGQLEADFILGGED